MIRWGLVICLSGVSKTEDRDGRFLERKKNVSVSATRKHTIVQRLISRGVEMESEETVVPDETSGHIKNGENAANTSYFLFLKLIRLLKYMLARPISPFMSKEPEDASEREGRRPEEGQRRHRPGRSRPATKHVTPEIVSKYCVHNNCMNNDHRPIVP